MQVRVGVHKTVTPHMHVDKVYERKGRAHNFLRCWVNSAFGSTKNVIHAPTRNGIHNNSHLGNIRILLGDT